MDHLGDLALAAEVLRALAGLGPRLAFVLRGTHERLRPAGDRLDLLLDRAQRQPRVHLRLAGAAGLGGLLVAFGGIRLSDVLLGRRGLQPSGQLGELFLVAGAGRAGGLDGLGQSFGVLGGCGLRLPERAQLVGDGGQLRVGVVQRGQGVGLVLPGGFESFLKLVCGKLEPVGFVAGCGEGLLRLGEPGLYLEQRRRGGGAALHQPRGVEVAGTRHDHEVRVFGRNSRRVLGCLHHDGVAEEPLERAHQVIGGGDVVEDAGELIGFRRGIAPRKPSP